MNRDHNKAIVRIISVASVFTSLAVMVLITFAFQQSRTIDKLQVTTEAQAIVLKRRSPTLDHLACYEGRQVRFLNAQTVLFDALLDDDTNPKTPVAIGVVDARTKLSEARADLVAAVTPGDTRECPTLPGGSDR